MTIAPPIGTVKITRVRFLEEDVYDGGIPFESYGDADVEYFEADTVEDAVRIIQREGLTFSATGNDWAGNPDGSVIVDYGTGKREDATAHLIGFLPSEVLAIIHAVG